MANGRVPGRGMPPARRQPTTRKAGAGQQSMFTDLVPDKPLARDTTLKRQATLAQSRAVARGTRKNTTEVIFSDPNRKPFPDIDPTRTSNPSRPRTLQAGYDRRKGEATGVLRVRFRDGTPWEYQEVPPEIWQRFRRSASPGRFINRVLNQYPYNRGNF